MPPLSGSDTLGHARRNSTAIADLRPVLARASLIKDKLLHYMFQLGSSLVSEEVATADTVADREWEITWGPEETTWEPEAGAGKRVAVFRAWVTRLKTWRDRRSSSQVAQMPRALRIYYCLSGSAV